MAQQQQQQKALCGDKRVNSRQVYSSKGNKVHCVTVVAVTEGCRQRQLCDQVKPSARVDIARSLQMLSPIPAPWPSLLLLLLLHNITRTERRARKMLSNTPQIDFEWMHVDTHSSNELRAKNHSFARGKSTHDFRGLWMTVAIFLLDCNVIFQISV